MKNNENLSVEEILREADEMLDHINSRTKSSGKDAEDANIKTFTPKAGKNSSEKTTVSDKTRHVPVSDKTIVSERVSTIRLMTIIIPSRRKLLKGRLP